MSKRPSDPESGAAHKSQNPDASFEIEELRRLITGPQRSQIGELRERLENPEHRIRDVSQILPEAIALRASQDEKIAKVLAPTVEKAMESSIKRNRKVLVDVLFPVMGPAIRKAVAATIQGMIQSFDKTLQHSFSLQGLKWRIEALRTKKPFGEIVLLHTLLYQVEQVFLIHRATSVVLEHVVAKNIEIQDPDLVASMLSAIRDFVQDSFKLDKDESLDTLRMGDNRTIWIEQGSQALLAAVIRGTPPSDLRAILRETLDAIHLKFGETLDAFDGDPASFEAARPDLEDGLQSRYKPKTKKAFPVFWIVFGAAILALGFWTFSSIRGHHRWSRYLERLKGEPGIQITSAERRSGLYHVYGLRDPLAPDPAALLPQAKLKPERFAFHLESYTSNHPQVVLKRARKALDPPSTVSLEMRDDALVVSGSAPHAWIRQLGDSLKTVPGVAKTDDQGLIDQDLQAFETARKKIEESRILFEFRTAELTAGQEAALQALLGDIKELMTSAAVLERIFQIQIVGHADSFGAEQANLVISRERAGKILSLILKEGFEPKMFSAQGVGSKEPLKEEKTDQDREVNRSATFKITW